MVQIIQSILCTVPFILLCVAGRKENLNKADRGRQVLMPLIALVYCIIGVIALNKINEMILSLFNFIGGFIPVLSRLNLNKYLIYIFNTALITIFLMLKGIALPILKRVWSSAALMEKTSGFFYEYEEDIDKWVVKKEYEQVKKYCNGIYYAALTVSAAVFVLSQNYPDKPFFQTTFYPVFGVLVLGEVVNYLSGITKSEFVENILGEDEESYKIANYGLLRDILRDLFGNRVLYEATMDNGLDISSNFETLDEMCSSQNQTMRNLGQYFQALKENGENIDPSYVKSCVNLVQGQSTLFCNPFYRDLTNYVMFPMMKQLMRYRKCLVVTGRDSVTDDVREWLEQAVFEYLNTDSLWKVEILTTNMTEADIGIIRFSDLYNLEIQKNNVDFLQRVGFVFVVEPSRLLATGQVGMSLLVNRFDESREPVVYAACDRNCDGLVDALSHVLKTNITEVMATSKNCATTSVMCWNADGEYMHHKIFSNVSRYLGIGTEINAVAMKYQIANTQWISSDKFPVIDMKWIAGQYYKKICNYTDLPVSQDAFNKAFQVESNLWGMQTRQNAFLVVEDEFQNLFELARLFATRAEQQGFINVISENYLLRDYMLDNVQTFVADPKAVPTIVADYARTERNTVLKLIMRMSEEPVSEDEIAQAFMVSGIEFSDLFESLKLLIGKHCFITEINIRVYFKEKLMEDTLRMEVKKYYAIEGETEIAKYAQNLKNAYYITEDEKGEIYYIGAKLYGHVFQAMIPGQFLTFDGKYYEVQSITPQNGVVLRRAADHITNRKYYRQIRHIELTNWKPDENVGGQKSVDGIRIEKGYCQIRIQTEGYLEMLSYADLKSARTVSVSGIPQRSYRNKLVMKINLPDASESVRYTICLLLNEIFKTTYPDSYQYICAVTSEKPAEDISNRKKYMTYTMTSDSDNESIYIVEDSEIDLGLIASVERNLKRYFEIITEVLIWHNMKMEETPEEESTEEYVPEFDPEPEQAIKKKGFFGNIIEKVKSVWNKLTSRFKKKPRPEKEIDDEPKIAEEQLKDKSEKPEKELAGEQEKTGKELKKEAKKEAEEEKNGEIKAGEEKVEIEGEDEEIVSVEHKELTKYQKSCFLKYGFDEFPEFLDFEGTVSYLTQYGYDQNPLRKVRDGAELAAEYEKTYDPHKAGAHFCDFCGVELAGGEYELLKDGRERCNHCSMTALRSVDEFKEVFKTVMRNMEIFYGIRLNVAIKVRMTDAKKIAKHFGEEFVATPGFDGRTLGFAQKDSTGYSIYIENGSPKLAAMATIAHELTHIWQYQNWDDKEIVAKYGAHNKLEVYEGMAKWAEIQYLLYLNEVAYAKRQEIITRMRNDEYGKGFIKYAEKYSLSYSQVKKHTPFDEIPPL